MWKLLSEPDLPEVLPLAHSPYLRLVQELAVTHIQGAYCALCGQMRPPTLVMQRLDGGCFFVPPSTWVPPAWGVTLCRPCAVTMHARHLALYEHISLLGSEFIVPPSVVRALEQVPAGTPVDLVRRHTIFLPVRCQWQVWLPDGLSIHESSITDEAPRRPDL